MVLNNTLTSPNISTKTAGWVISFSSLSHSLIAGHQYLGNTTLPGEFLQWNFPELPGFPSVGLTEFGDCLKLAYIVTKHPLFNHHLSAGLSATFLPQPASQAQFKCAVVIHLMPASQDSTRQMG